MTTRVHVCQTCAKKAQLPIMREAHFLVQVLVLGGGGRVGSAVAIHLLSQHGLDAPLQVTVAGRRPVDDMAAVLSEIVEVCTPAPWTWMLSSRRVLRCAIPALETWTLSFEIVEMRPPLPVPADLLALGCLQLPCVTANTRYLNLASFSRAATQTRNAAATCL